MWDGTRHLHLHLHLFLMFHHPQIALFYFYFFPYTTNVPTWPLKNSRFPYVCSVINCPADNPETDLLVSSPRTVLVNGRLAKVRVVEMQTTWVAAEQSFSFFLLLHLFHPFAFTTKWTMFSGHSYYIQIATWTNKSLMCLSVLEFTFSILIPKSLRGSLGSIIRNTVGVTDK